MTNEENRKDLIELEKELHKVIGDEYYPTLTNIVGRVQSVVQYTKSLEVKLGIRKNVN